MPIRISRATSVIVHQVPPAAAERFLAHQEELTRAVESFPGYQATEVYPPNEPKGTEWVVVIHFTDAATLKGWLDAPVRAEWIEKVHKEIGTFRQETLATGFGAWFTKPTPSGPPGWKMVLTVLLGLYPTVIFLTLTVGRITNPWGMAISMLIGNAMSVSMLQYMIMPVLTRVFAWWIHANGPGDGQKTLAGVGIIAALLAVITVISYQITG
jgi:antibiotic biosynthesis monooxygenase (ABM) superfamily enzyme